MIVLDASAVVEWPWWLPRGEKVQERLSRLDVALHAFLPAIWRLRDNLTAYDGAYVALAEALDAPLVTLDARLASTPGHAARTDVVS